MFTDTLVLASTLCWLVYTRSYKISQPNIAAVSAAIVSATLYEYSLLALVASLALALATAVSSQQSNAIACLHLVYCCYRIINPSMVAICAAAAHFIAAWNLLAMQIKQTIYLVSLEAFFINTHRYIKIIQSGNLEAVQIDSRCVTKTKYLWDPTQKLGLLKTILCVHWQRLTIVSVGLIVLKLVPYYQKFILMQLFESLSNWEFCIMSFKWILLNLIEIPLLHLQEEKNQTINTIIESIRMNAYEYAFTCKDEYSQSPFDIDTAIIHISNFRNVLYSALDLLVNISTQFASVFFIATKLGWSTATIIFVATLFSMAISLLKHKPEQDGLAKSAITPQVIIDNMRTIKQYAWESKLFKLIDYNTAHASPRLQLLINGILDRISAYGPKVVASLAILYKIGESSALSYAELSMILYEISLLANYMGCFKQVPTDIAEYIEFENYIKIPLQPTKCNYISHKADARSDSIVLDKCSFSWSSFTLQSLSLVVKQGSFVTIEGKVGSGKSSLMAALCGEMPLISGHGAVYGKISFVGQKPWIMNATFRDNILFGNKFDEQKYQQIIYACALHDDIQLLPFKDMFEIGRKGVNLSGGQKARLALARAIYNDADVYILDDVLSAVDAQVERHLIDNVLNGMLKNKTRVLVTHAEHIMRLGDMRLLVENGKITTNHAIPVIAKHKQINQPKANEVLEDTKSAGHDFNVYLENNNSKHAIIWKFIKLSGLSIVVITMTIQFAHSLVQTHVLSIKSSLPNSSKCVPATDIRSSIKTDLLVYLLAVELQNQVHAMENVWAKAAVANMQGKLMQHLLYSKITFTERLSKSTLSNLFRDIIGPAIMVKYGLIEIANRIFDMTAIIVKQPFATLAVSCILPLPVYFYRKLKKLQLSIIKKSNQCSLQTLVQYNDMENEVIDGRAFLRIHGKLNIFVTKLLNLSLLTEMINKQSHLLEIYLIAINQLIQMFLNLIILAFIKWKYAMLNPGYIEQIIKLNEALYNVFKNPITANIQLDYSLPKIGQYFGYVEGIEQESFHHISDSKRQDWLQQGVVEFKDYSLQYRPDLPLVLQNISFKTQPGEKIGIVGRTGAGKSSLTLALLRMVEAAHGSIYIDGVDISTIGLYDLRSSIAMVPQDPMILPGTIRSNLDPGNEYTDKEVQSALEKTGIWPLLDDSLDTQVDGASFSVGQKQLLSLSRALLWNRKIVILDEATANIDSYTDHLIQQIIRREFANSTVLTIAHRLNTVMDSDRILVMDKRHIAEFDAPCNLLQKPDSQFKQMADSMNYNK